MAWKKKNYNAAGAERRQEKEKICSLKGQEGLEELEPIFQAEDWRQRESGVWRKQPDEGGAARRQSARRPRGTMGSARGRELEELRQKVQTTASPARWKTEENGECRHKGEDRG